MLSWWEKSYAAALNICRNSDIAYFSVDGDGDGDVEDDLHDLNNCHGV